MGASPRGLLTNALLAGGTALRHVRDDPVHFALQLGQRFPRAVAAPAARLTALLPGGTARAWSAWLRGDRPAAVAALEAATPRTRGSRRAAAALALAADRPDLVPADAVSPLMSARARWGRGELTPAIDSLADAGGAAAAYRRVLEGERTLLQPSATLAGASGASGASGANEPNAGRADERVASPRILHLLTNSLPHTQSGYTLRSHSILRAQRGAGLDVRAVTRLGYPVTVGKLRAGTEDVIDGIRYRRLLAPSLAATPPLRLEQQLARLTGLSRAWRPDVIHTTTHYPNAIAAQALARQLGVPWTYEVRGMLEKTWVASRATPEAREAAGSSERFELVHAREAELAAAADHVFTLSETMRDELVSRGVARERITLIPNAIDASLLESPPNAMPDAGAAPAADVTSAARAFRERLGLPSEGCWVGAVSSLVDYEGHDTLVDAVALLRQHGVDARLLLVGDGVARPSLERRVRESGLDAFAVLPGRVSSATARDYVRALDAVVLARHDLEVTRSVTPLKPIEAMAIGRPVVVSELPPLRELAGTETDGGGARALVVPPGDPAGLAAALRTILEHPDRRDALVAAGRVFARERTWEAAAASYRRVYDRLIGASGADGASFSRSPRGAEEALSSEQPAEAPDQSIHASPHAEER